MIKTTKTLGVFLLLVFASGCPDSPASLTHELLVFWNEVCDNTVKINTDEDAQKLLKGPLKRLDLKYVDLKDRASKRLLAIEKKDQALELEEALLDSFHEIVATEKRVKNCQERLEKLSKETPTSSNIVGVIKWIKEKQDFNPPLGSSSYTANQQDGKVKQFGKGLVLPWPKMDQSTPAPQNPDPPEIELSQSRIPPLCLPALKA